MFSLRITGNGETGSPLHKLTQGLQPVLTRLAGRTKITCEDFNGRLKVREELFGKAPFTPIEDLNRLFPGTYHLLNIDDKHCRKYARVPVQN